LNLKSPEFNIAAINLCTQAEGPFKRMAIWFQGCDKRCPSCCNPEYFSSEPAHIMPMEALIEVVCDSKRRFEIEGVTYLGGEPVLQQKLSEMSLELRKMNIGIILFTGRQYHELPVSLAASVDMVIDGGFEKDNVDNERNLIGSKNQKIYFITERYKNCADWFYVPRPKQIEINVSDVFTVNGDYVIKT